MKREHALFSVIVVIVAGFAFVGSYASGTSVSGVGARCDFSPEVVAVADQIESQPRFIQLEDGANYALVSAYQNEGVETAYVNGTPLPNGAVSYDTTIYYPSDWFFWFMALPTYCANGGSWVGVPFIRADVDVNPDGRFNLSTVGFYHSIFYPNGTG
jgi:hypothetical protein